MRLCLNFIINIENPLMERRETMNTTLTTFLKIGVTVIVIAALLFSVGYQTVEDEVNHYISDDITNTNHDLNTTGSMNR
jgi:hypothetical protein